MKQKFPDMNYFSRRLPHFSATCLSHPSDFLHLTALTSVGEAKAKSTSGTKNLKTFQNVSTFITSFEFYPQKVVEIRASNDWCLNL